MCASQINVPEIYEERPELVLIFNHEILNKLTKEVVFIKTEKNFGD